VAGAHRHGAPCLRGAVARGRACVSESLPTNRRLWRRRQGEGEPGGHSPVPPGSSSRASSMSKLGGIRR
jgi:hypothetical protein